MKPESVRLFREIVKQESGLVLGDDKGYLLESRLMPVARKWKLADLDAIAAKLRQPGANGLVREVVDAMTTNESFFFRDNRPFDQFRDFVLPQLMRARSGQKRFRIWSAACSNGQEPYSLAILLQEAGARLAGWKIDIVATDISPTVLERARAGLYSQFEVQRGLPITLLVKYFKQEGDKWRIGPGLRSMVDFREFNLLNAPRPLGMFDVVFCRNVLIYFDQPTKKQVLEQIAAVTTPDGVMFLGGAETVLGLTNSFVSVQGHRGIYEKSGSGVRTDLSLARTA